MIIIHNRAIHVHVPRTIYAMQQVTADHGYILYDYYFHNKLIFIITDRSIVHVSVTFGSQADLVSYIIHSPSIT